jgi:branched-chain amino acid transport system substrate-binding protein
VGSSFRMPAALASVVALCFVSACGGGSNNTATDTSPIKVGELFAISGARAFIGNIETNGAAIGVYEVNNNGGVSGRQLTEHPEDTGGDAVDAVPAFRKIMLDKPSFFLGPSSVDFSSVIKEFDAVKTPAFFFGGTTQLDQNPYKYVFRTTASDSDLTAAEAYFAIQKGWTNAVMLFDNTSDAVAELTNLTKYYGSHGGKILQSVSLVPAQSSYRTELTRAFSTKPDVVFFKSDPQTSATLFNNMKELGYLNVPVVGDDTAPEPDFTKAMGVAYASKYLYGMSGSPVQGPANDHFLASWNAAKPGKSVTVGARNLYDAVIISALAMTLAKSSDPKVWVPRVTDVTNPPGTVCNIYADCVKLINQGKKINYQGAAVTAGFDKYRNTFGDWLVTQVGADGTTQNGIMKVPATAVAQYKG